MAAIRCLINGQDVSISDQEPTKTLLYWLREQYGLKGTKEGCNEGDCGACTVLVSDIVAGRPRHRAINACILFLPQLHHKAIRTIEGVADEDVLHPVQQAMVMHHGSQCGFCTPGIVMSLVAAHAVQDRRVDDVLAGNLCRCTGYASIVRAAEDAMTTAEYPKWLRNDMLKIQKFVNDSTMQNIGEFCFIPQTLDDLCTWYAQNPKATLIAGATDVGLWVTKQFRDLGKCAFLGNIPELVEVHETAEEYILGAMVNMNRVQEFLAEPFADFAELIRRFGSVQVRNTATLGGNIANGSPIGDTPPALIALGARLQLRFGNKTRRVACEDFFVEYGKQDRVAGEVLTHIIIPKQPDYLRCYKISKRFDQDISALCGCFVVHVDNGMVSTVRLAFGGMAGVPLRAKNTERAMLGQAWSVETIEIAKQALAVDFTPLSDMRASREYRLLAAQNLLMRYFLEETAPQTATRVQAITS